jgi:Polyketide cyclase / dehydrase and lipid transport
MGGGKKVRIEMAQVVKAPREQVFQAWTDYDAWPKFSPLFTRVTVAERAGNTVRVETEIKILGRKARRTEKHVLTPPQQVLVEGETEGTPNTTLWKFEAIPEGDPIDGGDRNLIRRAGKTPGAPGQASGAKHHPRLVAGPRQIRGGKVGRTAVPVDWPGGAARVVYGVVDPYAQHPNRTAELEGAAFDGPLLPKLTRAARSLGTPRGGVDLGLRCACMRQEWSTDELVAWRRGRWSARTGRWSGRSYAPANPGAPASDNYGRGS